jgi:hypothetical protein
MIFFSSKVNCDVHTICMHADWTALPCMCMLNKQSKRAYDAMHNTTPYTCISPRTTNICLYIDTFRHILVFEYIHIETGISGRRK